MPIVKIYNTGKPLCLADEAYGLNGAIVKAACSFEVFGFSEKDFCFFDVSCAQYEEGQENVLIQIEAVYPKPERTPEYLRALAQGIGSAADEFLKRNQRPYPVMCIVTLLPETSTVWETEDPAAEN